MHSRCRVRSADAGTILTLVGALRLRRANSAPNVITVCRTVVSQLQCPCPKTGRVCFSKSAVLL